MPDLNFDIEISVTDYHDYRIVVQSPDGEFQAKSASPFARQEIRDYLAYFNQLHLNADPADSQAKIRQFGQRLFEFLIGNRPEIWGAYCSALEHVGTQRLFLRLSVEQAGRLAPLPWEYLCTPGGEFLALSPRTPIIRQKPELDLLPAAPFILPLRVLVVIASPPNYPALDVRAEWLRLRQATARLKDSGQLLLEQLHMPTWSALRRQLRQQDYQVLHYIGYTQFDEMARQGYWVLEDDGLASGSRPVSAAELGNELSSESTIRLVMVQPRSDGAHIFNETTLAIAHQLLESGTPAVVTTQFPLSEAAESILNAEFYAPLCEGHPVEVALNVARRAIMSEGEWGGAALFTRSNRGQLFRPTKLPNIRR